MADTKISALPASTTPLTGAEVLPVVQSSVTKQVSIANLTAGRNISTQNITAGSGATSDNVDITLAADTGSFILRNNRGGHYLDFVDSYGYTPLSLQGGNSVITGNLVQGIAAKGVNFTANTPAAGMTSQLLNWYEEGTWTPVYVAQTGTLGTVTYENVQGRYVKVGRQVTVTGGFYCSAFAAGTGSGDLRIGGLPFANSATFSTAAISDSRLFTLNNPTSGFVNVSTTTITLFYRTTANGAINNLQVSDAATGSGALNLVYFTATYQV